MTSLRRLLLVSPETPLKRIMTPDSSASGSTPTRRKWRGWSRPTTCSPIPVVDEHNKLVGVITVDDVIDVIKEEATEDMYRMAGVSGEERIYTPLSSRSASGCRGWSSISATAFLAASVVGLFEGTIQRCSARGLHADRRRHGRKRRARRRSR